MEKLGLLDQLFYKADEYGIANIVMGGAWILEPARPRGQLNLYRVADHIMARLEKIPRLRQKFIQDPLRIGRLRKVEDSRFDIRQHILTERVAAPGDSTQLAIALGRVCSQPVDIKELWRFTLLDGLQGGRLMLVMQLHHALFDGLGAGQVISSLYDSVPVRLEKPVGGTAPPTEEPGSFTLLGDSVMESARRLFVSTPLFVRDNTLPLAKALAGGIRDLISSGSATLAMPEMHATILNTAATSGKRVVAYRTLSLPEFKALARHHHATVNDLALLLFSYALEYFLRKTREKFDFDLFCSMPISTRSEESTAGNQVTAGRINLHNTVSDPLERLQAIQIDTRKSKQAARPESPTAVDIQALGELVSPLALEGLLFTFRTLGLFKRLGSGFPLVHAILSNLPGPREDLFIGNSRLAESIPIIPAGGMVAVSGGITSVSDTITMGFNCDADVVPHPELLAEGVDYGLAILKKAAG